MRRTSYEYIVLGLGGLGSGAAYWLSKRAGANVLGIEQFELGHVRGESQDHSRIIRLSYHLPVYVELAKRAYESWDMLAADAGESLVLRTGGLDLGPRSGAIPLQGYADSMSKAGVAYEWLDAREIMRRWPQWTLPDDVHGLFQARAGIAMAARANAAHQKMARAFGATLLENTKVTAIASRQGEVQVYSGGVTYTGRQLIVAAGPWSSMILGHLGADIPLEVTQEQVTYFASPTPEAFAPDRFPVWIWMDDPSYYGFPVFGEKGPKVARDAGGKPVTADTRTFEPDAEAIQRIREFLAKFLPGAAGPEIYTKTCLYTLTPDRDFVIDRVPGTDNVWIAIGAGHAFKFASVIGRILSELAIDARTPSDLHPFGIERPVLKMANPPKHYMQ
ncbi:MAG TPA: N-methyl-L-tryptophan oxidase [Gemmatimonadaceae bacterium]|jgi:sarcosine oxidase|nr:N-methyl-L-tryptophan oxidase [Gemmatimonadaceae bacterium]